MYKKCGPCFDFLFVILVQRYAAGVISVFFRLKAKLPLRDLKVGVKIGAWAALFIRNLITLVKVLSRSDHLVRSYIAKKFWESEFEARLTLQESWFYLPLWAPKSVAKKANTWQKKPTHGKKSQCLAKKILELTIEQTSIEIDRYGLNRIVFKYDNIFSSW